MIAMTIDNYNNFEQEQNWRHNISLFHIVYKIILSLDFWVKNYRYKQL